MRQVDYGVGGEPDVLKIVEGPVPQPGPDDVLIAVHYAGVNGPDLAQRKGRYPPPPRCFRSARERKANPCA